MNLTKVDIEILRNTHRSRGIQLITPSGPLSGDDGSELSLVTALLDECDRSLAKDAEIASLRAQLDEFKKAAERICRFDWSSNEPNAVRAIGALRFLLQGSAK